MISDRIKKLREQNSMTQSELAKRLSITRSSVNAWEMGISVPSTQSLVDLTNIFDVSADYLLGLDTSTSVNLSGLTDKDINLVYSIVAHLREKNFNSKNI